MINGKPRQGSLFELRKRTRARFKCALRFIKSNEESLRRESLAKKLSNKDVKDFWKEIRYLNNSNMPLPNVIDEVHGVNNIVEMWDDHYNDLFNCLQDKRNASALFNSFEFCQDMIVSSDNVISAINRLDCNKSNGFDGINVEHLKFCSEKVLKLLALCFSSFFIHGFLPNSMLEVLLVPLVKNKSESICKKSNYRPIALASIMSKVLEYILYDRMEMYLLTSCNQFGFKKRMPLICVYTY